MSSRRLETIFRHGSNGHVSSSPSRLLSESPDDVLLRVLVMDDDPHTTEMIENALWIWPHRVSRAEGVAEAIRMCEHLTPAAAIVSLNHVDNVDGQLVSNLHTANPDIPIVVIGSAQELNNPGSVLGQGASAIVSHENLQLPTLHDLLTQLQQSGRREDMDEAPELTRLQFPWRDSGVFGAIICNISGKIIAANKRLADLLGYADPESLLGKDVRQDLLCSKEDWEGWKAVAGDTEKLLRQSLSVQGQDNQLRTMVTEVFAAPHAPTSIQVVFVDLTELV